MIRAIIVIVTVLFLIGSFAYAEYGTENGLLGVMAEPEGENIDGDQNDHEEERSDAAEAVLGVLDEWEEKVEKSPKDGNEFGEEVAELAREGNLGEEVAAAAREANNNEEENDDANDNNNNDVNGDEPERSEVADAVLGVLGDGASPGGGNEFGQNVADQATEDGPGLGSAVSGAARDANSSAGAGGGNNPASNRSPGGGNPNR